MNNFWQKLRKPFFILAPMEDVTDNSFRQMFAKYGKPEVLFTEFVSTDGLMHEEGRKRLSEALEYTEEQRPVVAQIWGNKPELFYEVAKYVAGLGFDGIDINMGCPQSKEIQAGACAALIRQPELAKEIIRETKRGAVSPAGELPVSVKTRIGYSKDTVEEWVGHLLEAEPAAITLHGRTKQEKSAVPAHWDAIARAVEVRNRAGSKTLIVGNGDIKSREEGLRRAAESGVDGVMIGRGAFGNPWLFREDGYEPGIRERLGVMIEHAELYQKLYGGNKPFVIMRKHFKAYAGGFPGASELRAKLMELKSLDEARQLVEEYLHDRP